MKIAPLEAKRARVCECRQSASQRRDTGVVTREPVKPCSAWLLHKKAVRETAHALVLPEEPGKSAIFASIRREVSNSATRKTGLRRCHAVPCRQPICKRV